MALYEPENKFISEAFYYEDFVKSDLPDWIDFTASEVKLEMICPKESIGNNIIILE